MSIHYVEAGEGPLVVLLHGFPEFWYSWLPQIPGPPDLMMPRFRFSALRTLLRLAGNFDSRELDEYVEAWRKPGALRGMTNYYRALRRHRRELRPLIRPIDIPTLLIWGERDP